MKFNKIDEGLFKDIDKEIVNIDDPNYEQKVKDQTFNDFQASDLNKRKDVVKDWLETHVYIRAADQGLEFFLTPDKEGQYYEIEVLNETSPGADNFIINIINTAHCYIVSTKNNKTPLNENGELPYRFGYCSGNFEFRTVPGKLKHMITFNDQYVISRDIPGTQLTSFKNFPNHIKGGLCIRNAAVFANQYIDQYYTLPSLSTLPKNMIIEGDNEESYTNKYAIHLNGVKGVQNFNEMSSGLHIKRGCICIYDCPDFINFEGWNNKIEASPNCSIDIDNCIKFESLKGLPDDFICQKIHIRNTYKFDKIKNWPSRLRVSMLMLEKNRGLNAKALMDYPFPYDMKVGDFSSDVRYNKNISIPIPPGFKFINMMPDWHYMKQNPGEEQKNQINEGLLKDLDNNIVDVDDPDYENKIKDQTFKDFREADINRRKSVIEEWIYDNIVINPNSSRPYWGAGSSGAYRHLEPDDKDKYFYVDDEYRIHLIGPALSMMPSFKLTNNMANSKAETILSEIPYKIKECQGDFDASHTHITSLKNFPESLGKPANPELYWAAVKTDKNDKWVYGRLKIMYCYGLTSLVGCPQWGVRSVDCYDCNLTSLEGLPPTIAGYIDARNNCLRSLNYCPAVIVQDSRSDFQGNYIPAEDLWASAEKLHWEKEEVLDQISTQRKG